MDEETNVEDANIASWIEGQLISEEEGSKEQNLHGSQVRQSDFGSEPYKKPAMGEETDVDIANLASWIEGELISEEEGSKEQNLHGSQVRQSDFGSEPYKKPAMGEETDVDIANLASWIEGQLIREEEGSKEQNLHGSQVRQSDFGSEPYKKPAMGEETDVDIANLASWIEGELISEEEGSKEQNLHGSQVRQSDFGSEPYKKPAMGEETDVDIANLASWIEGELISEEEGSKEQNLHGSQVRQSDFGSGSDPPVILSNDEQTQATPGCPISISSAPTAREMPKDCRRVVTGGDGEENASIARFASGPVNLNSPQKRAPGRPLGSKNKRAMVNVATSRVRFHYTTGQNGYVYQVHTPAGGNVVQNLMEFSKCLNQPICVVSAHGKVKNVMLCGTAEQVHCHGVWDLVNLCAKRISESRSDPQYLRIAGSENRMEKGRLIGDLIAEGPVTVNVLTCLCSSPTEAPRQLSEVAAANVVAHNGIVSNLAPPISQPEDG